MDTSPAQTESQQYLTSAEAAERLGVNDATIRKNCIAGNIPGAKKTRYGVSRFVWAIPVEWVESVLAER